MTFLKVFCGEKFAMKTENAESLKSSDPSYLTRYQIKIFGELRCEKVKQITIERAHWDEKIY